MDTCHRACVLPPLTFQCAQGRCPGGCAEQAHHQGQYLRRSHRRFVPLRKVQLRPLRFQHRGAELLLSAATHPQPDFIGVLTVQRKTKTQPNCTLPFKTVGTHLRVISKHYSNWNKMDILLFPLQIKAFFGAFYARHKECVKLIQSRVLLCKNTAARLWFVSCLLHAPGSGVAESVPLLQKEKKKPRSSPVGNYLSKLNAMILHRFVN